jgi:hypothetical protein
LLLFGVQKKQFWLRLTPMASLAPLRIVKKFDPSELYRFVFAENE